MEQQINLEKVKNKENNKLLRVLMITLSSISFASVVILLAMYVLGGIELNYETLNPVSAINFIIQIFNIDKYTVYEVLSNFSLGIMYIIVLILMIKCTISALIAFKAIIKNVEKIRIISMHKKISKAFTDYFIVLIMSYMINPYSLNKASILVIALAFIFFLIKELTMNLFGEIDVKNLVMDGLGVLILATLVAFLSKLTITGCIYNFSEGITLTSYMLNNSGDLTSKQALFFIYHYLGKYVLYLVLAINYMVIMGKTLNNNKNNDKIEYRELLHKLISISIFVFIFMLIDCFMENNLFQENITFTTEMLKEWIRLSKHTFVAIIIVLVSGIVLLCGPIYKKEEK